MLKHAVWPMQLSLFREMPPPPLPSPRRQRALVSGLAHSKILLARILPEQNEWRFRRLELLPNLFGQACLVRKRGRIGRPGRLCRDPFPDHVRASSTHDRLAGAKRQRPEDRVVILAMRDSHKCQTRAYPALTHENAHSERPCSRHRKCVVYQCVVWLRGQDLNL